MRIRKLEPHRRHAENDLTLFRETAHGYIYVRSFNDYVLGYEVFEKRVEPAESKTIDNRLVTLPDREKYPSSSDFGDWAWYTRDQQRAGQILDRFTTEAAAKAVTPVAEAVVDTPVVALPTPAPVQMPVAPAAPLPRPVPPPVLQDTPADGPMVLGLF